LPGEGFSGVFINVAGVLRFGVIYGNVKISIVLERVWLRNNYQAENPGNTRRLPSML